MNISLIYLSYLAQLTLVINRILNSFSREAINIISNFMFFEFYQIFFLSIYRLFWLNTVTFCDTCSSYKTLRLHSNHKTRLYFVNLRISDKTDTIMSPDIASFQSHKNSSRPSQDSVQS